MTKKSEQFKIGGVQKKQEKANKKVGWLAAGIILVVLLAVAGWFGYQKWFANDEKTDVSVARFEGRSDIDDAVVTEQQKAEYTVAPDKPRYMSIPKIEVSNARVVELGVNANNQLDAPKGAHDAGWYIKSALPGTGSGAVLMDAHNTGVNERSGFFFADKLVKGDIITVEMGDGKKYNYSVVENEMPLLGDVDMAKMLQPVDPSKEGLNFITCGGTWLPDQKTFDRRITIRAVRES